MPAAAPLCAQFTDQERTVRQQARPGARRTLPNRPPLPGALALATCEVEAGLRSASQLERICHPSLWVAVAHRIQRAGSPTVSGATVLRVQAPGAHAGPGRCRGGGPPVGSERCSWRCGWRRCRAAGS
jgi:hypothetical protein